MRWSALCLLAHVAFADKTLSGHIFQLERELHGVMEDWDRFFAAALV